jgi:hypothetical protein
VIAPLLRVAMQAAAARSLRLGAQEMAMRATLVLVALAAVAVGAGCLSVAAVILLGRRLDPAAAWAIVGALWGAAGLVYLMAARRRR